MLVSAQPSPQSPVASARAALRPARPSAGWNGLRALRNASSQAGHRPQASQMLPTRGTKHKELVCVFCFHSAGEAWVLVGV